MQYNWTCLNVADLMPISFYFRKTLRKFFNFHKILRKFWPGFLRALDNIKKLECNGLVQWLLFNMNNSHFGIH